jgi:hypothetical protein
MNAISTDLTTVCAASRPVYFRRTIVLPDVVGPADFSTVNPMRKQIDVGMPTGVGA